MGGSSTVHCIGTVVSHGQVGLGGRVDRRHAASDRTVFSGQPLPETGLWVGATAAASGGGGAPDRLQGAPELCPRLARRVGLVERVFKNRSAGWPLAVVAH